MSKIEERPKNLARPRANLSSGNLTVGHCGHRNLARDLSSNANNVVVSGTVPNTWTITGCLLANGNQFGHRRQHDHRDLPGARQWRVTGDYAHRRYVREARTRCRSISLDQRLGEPGRGIDFPDRAGLPGADITPTFQGPSTAGPGGGPGDGVLVTSPTRRRDVSRRSVNWSRLRWTPV